MNVACDESDFGFYPALLQLGLTYRCNLQCPHCYTLYRRTSDELSTDEVKCLIDDAYELGARKVVYSHGENLLHQNFHELAFFIHRRGFFQTLMANGYYLRREDQVDQLVQSGVNKVMISLDSDAPEEHNQNRGIPNAFDIAIGALKQLKNFPQIKVGISMAITERNYGRIPGVVALAESLGLEFVSLMQVRPNKPLSFLRNNWSTYQNVARDIYELILAYQGRLDVYTHDPFMITLIDARLRGNKQACEEFIARNRCNVGKYVMSICPNGDIVGCNFIGRVVGNVRTEPLHSIWGRLVEDYDDSTIIRGPCRGCLQQNACRGGCKAFHLSYPSGYDKRCELKRFGSRSAPPHLLTAEC